MKKTERTLHEKLTRRENENTLRSLSFPGGIDLSSNDYLGFARSPQLAESIRNTYASMNAVMNGASGSRLLSGNSVYAEGLEQMIASFHHAETGLLFNSGYDANLGLISCVAGRQDIILYDEWIHASIIDGIRLSPAKSYKFRHNNLDDLEQKLARFPGQSVFIAVESVYSMDGDSAPLEAIAGLASRYEANLIVDEAHATGTIGHSGQGLINELGLEDACFARIHTFGKALGTHGAIVLGSPVLRNYLINFSRPFIYTTALPVHSLVAVQCAYHMMEGASAERAQLMTLIDHFRNLLKRYPSIRGVQSSSSIQGILIPGNLQVKQVASELQKAGFDIRPILSPTVPEGTERLRICLHAYNTTRELDALFETIQQSLSICNI